MFDTRIAHMSYYIPENNVPVEDIVNSVSDKDIPAVFAGKEAYIPLHEETILKIDRKKNQVIVSLPPGLLEIYQ